MNKILAILLLTNLAVGQSLSHTIEGEVRDTLGATVVNAQISVSGPNNQSIETRTGSNGQFTLTLPSSGTYRITVTAEGFAPFTQEFTGSTGRKKLNIVLDIFLSEQVEVKEGDRISTDPGRNISGLNFSEEEIRDLPDDREELIALLSRMAGPGNPSFYVDGFSNDSIPHKDAIQSIRINNDPFATEHREHGQGRIEIITKPGSEQLHGGIRFSFNDESLNARNAFSLTRPPVQTRNFGANLSGPIIRNRWGYFFSLDRRTRLEDDQINATILDANLQPTTFMSTLKVPTSSNEFMVRSKFLINDKHTLNFGFEHRSRSEKNRGLGSAFDLPERAYNDSESEQEAQVGITSFITTNLMNELKVEVERESLFSQAVSSSPAIIVFDAFNAGGNQGSLYRDVSEYGFEIDNDLTYTRGNHTFKTGFDSNLSLFTTENRSNFGGTFTFGSDVERGPDGLPVLDAAGNRISISPLERYRRTVSAVPGYGPSQFSIVTGDPKLKHKGWEFAWFLSDTWNLSDRLTLSLGLRNELQSHIRDRQNWAPRAGLAIALDKEKKSALRVGSGIFFQEIEDSLVIDSLRLNGERQRQFVVSNPPLFADPALMLSRATMREPTVRLIAHDIKMPYSAVTTVSYEREVRRINTSVGYTWGRHLHQLRSYNLNIPQPDGNRPFPNRGPVYELHSDGVGNGHELTLAMRSRLSRSYTLFSNYTFSSNRSNTGSAYSIPANRYDLRSEYGESGPRHRFFLGANVSLPMRFRINPFLDVTSGQPFNITTGLDNNGDNSFNDRPAFASAEDLSAIVTRFGRFNPRPKVGDPIIPRNYAFGPGEMRLNLNISKEFRISLPWIEKLQARVRNGRTEDSGPSLTLRADIQNILNRTNLAGYNGVLTSPLFGRANRALGARRIELGMRLSF